MGKSILKRLLTMTTGFILAAGVVFSNGVSMNVEAKDLTLITDSSKIAYGTLTTDDIALLRTIFDKDYYLAENPDVAATIGDNYEALLDHFCRYGIFEGRTCTAIFDASAYLAAYDDARAYAGKDIMKAYRHFIEVGLTEGRTVTNVQACIGAGITVVSIIDPEIKITPEVWAWSVHLGTKDYKTIIKTIDAAKTIVAENPEETVVITVSDEETVDPKNYKFIEKISIDGDTQFIAIVIVQNAGMTQDSDSGEWYPDPDKKINAYGAYRYVSEDENTVIIKVDSTKGFVGEDKYDLTGSSPALLPVALIDTGVLPLDELNDDEKAEYNVPDTGLIIAAEAYAIGNTFDIAGTSSSGTPYAEAEDDEAVFVAGDPEATDSTTYDVSFKFVDSTADSVSFDIKFEGSDGYTTEEKYTVTESGDDEPEAQ